MSIDPIPESRKPGLWRRLRMAQRILSGRPPSGGVTQDALVQLILDNVDAAITVYDAQGNLIRANKGAERLSGCAT